MVIFRCLNPVKITCFQVYISKQCPEMNINCAFTQLLKYMYRPIGIEHWDLKLKNLISQ